MTSDSIHRMNYKGYQFIMSYSCPVMWTGKPSALIGMHTPNVDSGMLTNKESWWLRHSRKDLCAWVSLVSVREPFYVWQWGHMSWKDTETFTVFGEKDSETKAMEHLLRVLDFPEIKPLTETEVTSTWAAFRGDFP